MQAMTPITPLEPGVEMFQRGKMQSLFIQTTSTASYAQRESTVSRSSQPRPVSEATEIFDTDIEDDSSEFEEDSPKYSFESNESRRSQTTLSSYDEIRTPLSLRPSGFTFKVEEMKPVEGPRGPHLFRASQTSVDFDFDFALQLSPVAIKGPMTLPPHSEPTPEHEFLTRTPATIVAPDQFGSLNTAIQDLDGSEVRDWTSMQVACWMSDIGFDGSVIEKFKSHDITGAVLLDMQFDDLKELDIVSFGKRHQLWNHIDALRDNDGRISPVPTPFQDISRPCTRNTQSNGRQRSKSRRRLDGSEDQCDGDDILSPITPGGEKKRRGRKHRNIHEPVTPAESVSIVAIEQLLPKPHKCAKGERCAKWRKQQRQLARLQEEHGFPISPENGGHIFIAGDPGNAASAGRIVENVVRPVSDSVPSVVASSAALPSAKLPPMALQEEMLQEIEFRDPQENVKQFLSLQGYEPYMMDPPTESPPTPPLEMFPPLQSASSPHSNLKYLPKLSIPRAASAQPAYENPRSAQPHEVDPSAAFSPCRTALSPAATVPEVYRFGTPASEMDVPVTAVAPGPVARDASQSVPPNMHYRDPTQRTGSRADWRRPSFALPSLHEGEVFSPNREPGDAPSSSSKGTRRESGLSIAQPLDPKLAHDLKPPRHPGTGPNRQAPRYAGATHSGWMKKRRTKLLRHEWQDAHFRLAGTQLAMHPNALPSSSALSTIDIDDYAVACSAIASSKLSAKLKALKISSGNANAPDGSAYSFQLVPADGGEDLNLIKRKLANGKTHHFAVTTRDERIDWMRELMLAKALRAKGHGYEVQVNGRAI